MTEARRCGDCGSELSVEASSRGLCARCLLEAALKTSQPTSDSCQETSPASPPSADSGPIDTAELSRLFPQLEIQKLLGRGGMGAVYLARQKALDRRVALKLLAPRRGLDAEFAERFGREARALARLSHPNIVAVHDFGETEGFYYLLMDYVDGTSLREVMWQGRLDPRQALALLPQICDALQYAHDEGVVHRDIKPENILLDKKGRIKIADFGLAKLLGATAQEEGLTGSHHVMGTRNYMAPEQLEHPKQVDHRADIYSLGVVFYEMLTGELPLGRFAPPSQKVHVDVRFDEVILRALEKEPDRRYQHASEIKSDIDEIPPIDNQMRIAREAENTSSVEPDLRRTRGFWITVAALLGAAVFWGIRKSGDPIWLVAFLPFLDLFFIRWFGSRYTSLFHRHRPPKLLTALLAAGMLFFFALTVFLPGTSSFIRSAISMGIWLLVAVYCGLYALSSETSEGRKLGVLALQTCLMIFFAYPAVKPLNYFGWIYQLSGVNPGVSDSLLLRLLFGAVLTLLVAWKVRTYQLLTQRPGEGLLARRTA